MGRPQVLGTGPWTGVLDTTDPFDDSPQLLVNASNGYFIDTRTPGGYYGRPGFVQGAVSETGLGPASCLYNFEASDGTYIRFFAFKGKLYRVTTSGLTFTGATDVTPVGVTIDATDGTTSGGPTARYYMTQLGGNLVFSDGVNRPWVGSALTSTPITAAYIDADGAGGTYAVQGQPTLYQGSLVMLLKSVGTASLNCQPGVGFLWSEPNQPTVGYEQTGYADFFNYIQTGSSPLYAALGTNEGLILWRETSIGIAVGPLNQLQSSPTTATLSFDVGTKSPAAVTTFGNNVFFVDRIGRPYRLTLGGGAPEPIWEQMRGQFDRNPSYLNYPDVIAKVAQAVVVPQLKVVLFAPFSPFPTGNGGNQGPIQPAVAFAFDAGTGIYLGTWTLRDGTPTFECMAVMRDGNNNPVVCTISNTTTGADTTCWFNHQTVLSAAQWYDTDALSANTSMRPTVTTGRLGYNADAVWNARRGTAIVMSSSAVTATVTTPYQSATAEGTVTPPTSDDSTSRIPFGLDIRSARGMQFALTPSTLTNQWGIQRVEVVATPSAARVEDA